MPDRNRIPAVRAVWAALIAVSVAVSHGDARAGTIGFKTDAKVTAGPGVDAEVTLSHTGDETASDVLVDAELLGKTVAGEKVSSIGPGQNHVWNFHLADLIPKGAYTIVIRAHYADSNGYDFEIVSTAAAPVGVTPAAKIFGSLDLPNVEVDGKSTATLNVKKPADRSGSFEVRLVAPSGFEVEPERATLDFTSSDKASAKFQIRNKDLLAGTSVNVFALVTGSDAGFPQTDTIRGMARVTAAVAKVTPRSFYTLAAVPGVLLVVLEALWLTGIWPRRRETA